MPRRLFFLMIVLWCAIPLSPQSVDSDFWGHVQYGWDTWHRGLARQATYTFTAVGHPWINHENLSELIMAWGAHGVGPTSLLVLKCLLGCVVLVLGIRRATQERPARAPGGGGAGLRRRRSELVVLLGAAAPRLHVFLVCLTDRPGRLVL